MNGMKPGAETARQRLLEPLGGKPHLFREGSLFRQQQLDLPLIVNGHGLTVGVFAFPVYVDAPQTDRAAGIVCEAEALSGCPAAVPEARRKRCRQAAGRADRPPC